MKSFKKYYSTLFDDHFVSDLLNANIYNDFRFQADSGGTVGSGGGSRRMGGQPGADQFVMKIPNNKVLSSVRWRDLADLCNFCLSLYVIHQLL